MQYYIAKTVSGRFERVLADVIEGLFTHDDVASASRHSSPSCELTL